MRLRLILMLLVPSLVHCVSVSRVPLTPAQDRVVAIVSETWRETGRPWGACTLTLGKLQIDDNVDACRGEVHGCVDGSVVHLEENASESLLVHELWHVMHSCSRADPFGDYAHRSGLWRIAGKDPRVDPSSEARAVRRVMGFPEPESGGAP